ncbi:MULTISPECIES: carboxylesterase family protein [Phenylobacterium]|uniref:Phospholipase/carboxylesterase n=1 Tax=Phenylobacterium koreense TaxID=266125 RepID=A0ABV2EFV4_9CAUL
MDDRELDELATLTGALLGALEALAFIGRRLNPPDLPDLMGRVGRPEDALREALRKLSDWQGPAIVLRAQLDEAGSAVLSGFDELRAAVETGDALRAFRGLRQAPLALEALYPLAAVLPPVNRFFLEPAMRGDAALQGRFGTPAAHTGVMHAGGEPGARGGFSLYVPEYYTPERTWPLVVALHGGSGNGRTFLWSWLRAARSHGAIVAAPTAMGQTWALSGPDLDTPNLTRILLEIDARWRLDPGRLLLTGLSDGGTFSYVSGLEPASPFTHLAPVAAAFHPMLAQMADADRLRSLPIHVVHGALDWMFPVDMARSAVGALKSAGAEVAYREMGDLAHTYPTEMSGEILRWLEARPRPAPG